MMKFSEFDKQCLENFKFNEGTLCWDETWIDGLCLSIDKLDEGGYEIETYYNALVKICLMNNVEM